MIDHGRLVSWSVVTRRDQGAGAGSPDWGVGPPRGGHQPQMAYDEPRRDSRDSLSRLSRDEAAQQSMIGSNHIGR